MVIVIYGCASVLWGIKERRGWGSITIPCVLFLFPHCPCFNFVSHVTLLSILIDLANETNANELKWMGGVIRKHLYRFGWCDHTIATNCLEDNDTNEWRIMKWGGVWIWMIHSYQMHEMGRIWMIHSYPMHEMGWIWMNAHFHIIRWGDGADINDMKLM